MSLLTNIVSYWKMQGNSNDETGTNNGSDTSITYGDSYGKIGNGALFASGSKINIGSNNSVACSYPFSISAWVYRTGINDNGGDGIIASRNAGDNGYLLGFWNDNKFSMTFKNATSGYVASLVTTSNTYSNNTWYHVVFTIDGSGNAKLYINGAQDGSGSWSYGALGNYGNCYIGMGQAGAYFNWLGRIDEVGFWSRELSGSEVTELYNGGSGLQYPFSGTAFRSNFFQML